MQMNLKATTQFHSALLCARNSKCTIMVSLQTAGDIIAISLMMVYVACIDIRPSPAETKETIDQVVERTFAGINWLADRAQSDISALCEHNNQIITQIVTKVGVAGNVNDALRQVNEIEQSFQQTSDRILDQAFTDVDLLVNDTNEKIDALVQHSKYYTIVDRTLRIMQGIVWTLHDWIRNYVSLLKPALNAVVQRGFNGARAAHAEALKCDTANAEKHYAAVLRETIDGYRQILYTMFDNIRHETYRQVLAQRQWSQILLESGHSVERQNSVN